jgi:NTP pyrophosphatase (non-canonical NTP hydrolase)
VDYREYTEGLVGDVGDLVKLVMTKARFRGNPEGVDKEIEHELSDILWSIIIISEELNVELDEVFIKQIEELRSRVKAK